MGYSENFYPDSYSSLSPDYGNFTGYRMNFGDIGTSMDARTANQVKEVSKHLNTGLKVFEIAAHSPEVFDAMPQEQLREINRLAKLNNATPTMHAPMIDPTGITDRGWDKLNQEAAKKQLLAAVERGHDAKPDGNIVITMHASTVGLPSTEETIKDENGKVRTTSMLLVNSQGKLAQIREGDEKYFPTKGEEFTGKVHGFNPDDKIKEINKEQWGESLQNITYNLDFAERGLEEARHAEKLMESKNLDNEEPVRKLKEKIEEQSRRSSNYLRRSYNTMKELFDLAYKNAEGEDKRKLDEYAKKIAPLTDKFDNITQNPNMVGKFSDTIEEGIKVLGNIQPKIFKPLKDFAREKSAESIGEIAFKSYKKFRKNDSAPIISVENHPAGQSLLTTGEDLKEVVEKARDNFEKMAMAPKSEGGLGLSRSAAKKAAEKQIGVTWDVGHINMIRKFGYNDKDIIKETEKVAPLVKHVHLSDNFGFEHSELPMGMGNVPIKEIMQKLGKEGFKGKKVVEALSWWQHFSEQGAHHAIAPTMEAFGSPMYGGGNGPYWNQTSGINGSYFGFPAAYLPEKHFSLYGSGFSGLPEEFGGQMPGTQSRFSGTANA